MPRRRADRAYTAAIARWETSCRDLPPNLVANVRRAWTHAERVRGQASDVPLLELVKELMIARDECPGDTQWWQHATLLAARAVRAARLLCPAKRRRKRRAKG